MRSPRLSAVLCLLFFAAACGSNEATDETDQDSLARCRQGDCPDRNREECVEDGICAGRETPDTCAADCALSVTCGNGTCDRFEDESSCSEDCAVARCNNDGTCDRRFENNDNCPADCPPSRECNEDGMCDAPRETADNCPADCAPPPICNNDGRCDPGETVENCPNDCEPPPICNNDGTCDPGETPANCPRDCRGTPGPVPGPDTTTPFPIDRGPESAQTPGSYKGLPLRLFDSGVPNVTPVRGVIGIVCIGMSNSFRECSHYADTYFPRGNPAPSINAEVRVANCAVGGSAIERWNSGDEKTWDPCLIGTGGRPSAIQQAGIALDQVRVIYHKAANQFTGGPERPEPAVARVSRSRLGLSELLRQPRGLRRQGHPQGPGRCRRCTRRRESTADTLSAVPATSLFRTKKATH